MTIREKANELISEGITDRKTLVSRISKYLKVKPQSVRIILSRMKDSRIHGKEKKLTISELIVKEKLDPFKLVKKTLTDCQNDECIYSDELRRMLGLVPGVWHKLCADKRLKKYQVELPNGKRVWAKDISKLLEIDGIERIS